jgi:hypothetical protein
VSYDDERPADWSTYDRAATAAADLHFLLFEMRAGDNLENLQRVMGPRNYQRAREYLDCVAANLKKMGAIALSLATTVMAQSTDPDVEPILARVCALADADDVNGAWNLVEAWVAGREIPDDEEDA